MIEEGGTICRLFLSDMNKEERAPTFSIGNVPIYGDAILSPMDGFSDYPFRSICRKLGSAASYTEFVKDKFIIHALEHIQRRFKYDEKERPVAFQIYGYDPDEILEAALRLEPLKPDILDINMGCPAKTVAHSGAGVGLMKTPLRVAHIFKKLSSTLKIPVTGKIRLGWNDCRNYLLIAKIIEDNGGAAIAIHARTKEQGYGGEADWDAIAEVKAAVKIPVIGNGNVREPGDIDRMKAHTGCDAVMIGRAAVGNPWIFARRSREEISSGEVRAMVHEHLEKHMAFYGERLGMMLFRKHAMQYLKLQKLPRAVRTKILLQEEPQAFLDSLDQVFESPLMN
jgi:tRNA-dihydrouridine synthase B